MKRLALGLAFALFLGQAFAAVKTPAQIEGEVALQYQTNGVGAISGPMVKGTYTDIAQSYIPYLASSSNCYWRANGISSPATCINIAGQTNTWTAPQFFMPGANWLTTYGYGTGQIHSLAAGGGQAVVGASRTSDMAAGPCVGCVSSGAISWGFNDKTDSPLANWANYVENRMFAGSGGGVTQETEVTNFGTANDIDPFGNTTTVGGSLVVAHHTGSGGGCGNAGYLCYNPLTGLTNLGHANPASAYYDTIHNGAAAYDGLIFFAGSIDGALGYSGFGRAITMTYGHELVWDYCDNLATFPTSCTPHLHGGIISSTVNAAANKQFLLFSNLGMTLSSDGALSNIYLQVPADTSYVNYNVLWPSATGVGTLIAPAGADAAINLQLAGKGAGGVVSLSKLFTPASTTSAASLSLAPGVAPTSPVNGDIWLTTTNLFARINGGTKTVADLESTQTFTGAKTFNADVTAALHYLDSSGVPAASACGTTPAVTAGSSNSAGGFTTGTGTPTACTITFANAYPTAAFCTVSPVNAAAVGTTVRISAQSASAFTITLGAGTNSAQYQYVCGGK